MTFVEPKALAITDKIANSYPNPDTKPPTKTSQDNRLSLCVFGKEDILSPALNSVKVLVTINGPKFGSIFFNSYPLRITNWIKNKLIIASRGGNI